MGDDARKSSEAPKLPSMIQASLATSPATLARHSSRGVIFQPGRQNSASRWMSGKPVIAASARANVLLPAPEMPMTNTRRMSRIQR